MAFYDSACSLSLRYTPLHTTKGFLFFAVPLLISMYMEILGIVDVKKAGRKGGGLQRGMGGTRATEGSTDVHKPSIKNTCNLHHNAVA